MRTNLSGGSSCKPILDFSRALCVGNTILVVAVALLNPAWRVEIELDAVLSEP